MLNIFDPKQHRFCDGLARRDFLRIGGLGAAGMALPDLFRARASQPGDVGGSGFGKAKSCIFLFLAGGPPHHENL
jgi:hypothetical protein